MLNSMSTESPPMVHSSAASKRLLSREGGHHAEVPMFALWMVSIVLFFALARLGSTLLPMADESKHFPLPFGSIDTLAGIITIYVTTAGGFLLTCALTTFLHEATHGLMYWVYGHQPQFKRQVMCADPARVTPNQQTFISLMPLFILSLMIVPLLLVPWLRFFALIALAGNVAGSLDDLWIAYRATTKGAPRSR